MSIARILRRVLLPSVLGALVLQLAACGPSPSVWVHPDSLPAVSTYEYFDQLPDDQRLKELVQTAEIEGRVTAQLRADRVFPELEAAFEAKYDIDLTIENPGRSDTVRQLLFAESRAGRQESDVVETYVHELNSMYAESSLVARTPQFIAATQSEQYLASEHAVESFQYSFGNMWNDRAEREDRAPLQLSELAGPKWGNELVMANSGYPWYIAQFQHSQAQGQDVEKFEELMKVIASRSSIAAGNNPAVVGIASGEFTAGVGMAHISAQKLGSKAPISWRPSDEPVFIIPMGVGLLTEAKHPAAALLFEHWYLTEGQSILEKEQLVMQSDVVNGLEGTPTFRLNVEHLSGKEIEQWRVAYRNLLTGIEPILPDFVRTESAGT